MNSSNYYKVSGADICTQHCPDGYFEDSGFMCTICHEACITC